MIAPMAVANAAVHAAFKMNCRNLRLWRKAVCFGFAENQEKRVNAAHRRFGGIVKLRVGVTVFSQLVHTLRRACAQIIEPPEHDRFSRTNFGARRCEAALLSVVTEGAFECAAGIGQRLSAAGQSRQKDTRRRSTRSRCKHHSARAPSRLRCERSRPWDMLRDNQLPRSACKHRRGKSSETGPRTQRRLRSILRFDQ